LAERSAAKRFDLTQLNLTVAIDLKRRPLHKKVTGRLASLKSMKIWREKQPGMSIALKKYLYKNKMKIKLKT